MRGILFYGYYLTVLNKFIMKELLKMAAVFFVVLAIFKVADKMFLDKALSSVFSWEKESYDYEDFETGVIPIRKGLKKRFSHKRTNKLAA